MLQILSFFNKDHCVINNIIFFDIIHASNLIFLNKEDCIINNIIKILKREKRKVQIVYRGRQDINLIK